MSEAERSDRLDPSRQATVDDIRALAGPATCLLYTSDAADE